MSNATGTLTPNAAAAAARAADPNSPIEARLSRLNPEIAALASKSDGELRAKAHECLADASLELRALRLSASGLHSAGVPIPQSMIDTAVERCLEKINEARKQLAGQSARASAFAIAKQNGDGEPNFGNGTPQRRTRR